MPKVRPALFPTFDGKKWLGLIPVPTFHRKKAGGDTSELNDGDFICCTWCIAVLKGFNWLGLTIVKLTVSPW